MRISVVLLVVLSPLLLVQKASRATTEPVVSIGDVSVVEGDVGFHRGFLPISISVHPETEVSVAYRLVPVTAQGGVAGDFDDGGGKPHTITFSPIGPLVQSVSVAVIGDLAAEGDEQFRVVLMSASGLRLGRTAATATILDDDSEARGVAVSVGDITIVEGSEGARSARVPIWLSRPSSSPVTLRVAITLQSAQANDAQGFDGIVTFPVTGLMGRTKTTSMAPLVTVFGDLRAELDETLVVRLTQVVGATVERGTGTITVVDDDHGISLGFVGKEEAVTTFDGYGLSFFPDGHIAFDNSVDGVRTWFAAGRSTYEFDGPDLGSLTPRFSDSSGRAVASLGASGHGFDRDYAGSGAVFHAPDGALLMLYHAEDQRCGGENAYVSIALARSTDDGATWSRAGPVISSPEPAAPCGVRHFSGAGSFSAARSADGRYVYLWFNQWLNNTQDEVYVARARVDSGLAPGSWSKYFNGRWSEPGLGGVASPVLKVPEPAERHVFVGLPSVSWNSQLGRWLAVAVSARGFVTSTSSDGTDWTPPELFLLSATMVSSGLSDGQSFVYYPTLLTTNATHDDATSGSLWLYYARGIKNRAPHVMVRRPVAIKVTGMS